ncbi:MAG: hypothetical protein HGA83_06880 [Bacteroidales bacterium]|nr:hypothetical protein [Bacteroidales bacterium]
MDPIEQTKRSAMQLIIRYWFLCVSVFFLAGSSDCASFILNTGNFIDEDNIKNGDIVFQRGLNALSRFVVSVDDGAVYSHVGIVYKSSAGTFVIHVLPDNDGETDAVVQIEAIGDFLSPHNTSQYAIYRYRDECSKISEQAAASALFLFRDRCGYDYKFDYRDHDRLYCTELVWYAYKNANIDLIDGRFEYVSFPFYKKRYILVSGLLKSEYLKLVMKNSIKRSF